MGCSVCCGWAGGLAPNPAGCPCCGPEPEEEEEFWEELEPHECDRCGELGEWEDELCCFCREDLGEDWREEMIDSKSGALYRTVTVTRTLETPERCSSPFESITCEMVCDDIPGSGQSKAWRANRSLNEQGEEVPLTKHERLLAQCLAAAGVDETGV